VISDEKSHYIAAPEQSNCSALAKSSKMGVMDSKPNNDPNRWGNPIAMIVVSLFGIAFIVATFVIEGQVTFDIKDGRTPLVIIMPAMLGVGIWLLIDRRRRRQKKD
jgi:hypothetical protein